MQVLGRTQPLAKYPVLRALEVIKALGFDGVEICLENDDMAPNSLTPERITTVRQRVTALDLKPFSISYHHDYLYSDAYFEMSKTAIQLTPEFGTNLFVFSGPAARTGDDEEFARMVDRTRELADIAESSGVLLAQEFEPNFVVGTTEQLLRLFDRGELAGVGREHGPGSRLLMRSRSCGRDQERGRSHRALSRGGHG